MKAVFDVKPDSGCDGEITRRHHFPKKRHYLDAAREAIGDWALFREPRRNGGRRAHPPPCPCMGEGDREAVEGARRATQTVPFVADGRYAEASLRAIANPSLIGQALQGKSMRPISPGDFDAIVLTGPSETLAPENAIRPGLDSPRPTYPRFRTSASPRRSTAASKRCW